MDASRRVRFAANDADDGELGADSPVGWTPMASLDAARERESDDDDDDDDDVTVDASTPTRTDATVAASHRRTPGTGSSENASSAVRARIANWESSASKSSPATTTTPPAPRFRGESGASAASVLMSGGGSGGSSAGVGVAGRWNVRRGEDAEDVKTTLFDASSAREAITMRGYRDVLDQARDVTDGAWARERAAMAVTVVTGAEDDARERRSRVARCARDDIRRVELKHSSVMASFAVRLRELKNAATRLPSYDASLTTRGSPSSGSRGKDAVGTPRRKLFLTGATTATASKHVNYSATRLASRGARASSSPGEPTLTSAQRERMKIEHVDVPTLLRRVAFAALAHNAEVARAKRHAANDMSLSHRLPILQRAFDALQAHTEICKPRRDAMRAACATFVNVAKRRAKRAFIRAWSRAARDGKIERASGAIHNIRVVEAALRHWELFATTRLWKRQSNALAERYAGRRRKTVAFCGWLRDMRRAKERRIAVRAKLFGMSVLEAQRAVHAELRYTARDATEKLKKELKFVYDECVESAARARVASSKKLASCLRGALRFTATERDIIWASSGAGDILGLGASLKNLALGFDIPSGARRGDKKNAEALARARGDAANSRLAADIEGNEDDDDDDDARLESSRRVDVDVVSAEAYECAREHQIALKNARDAAEKCTAARKTAHETELNASRLIANAESRANAAIQGAEDAMADSINAEYRAIEAEETARVAETRADRLAEAWAEADDDALAEALRHAADAATRSLTCSSAHAAAAKVAARAAEIAEDHKDAADVIKARARDDVDIARRNVIEAEAAVLHTAQVERQLKMKAMNAMRRLSALSEQRTSDHVVSEDKEAIRQRLTWASYGVDDDDDDEEIDVRKVSMKPGAWHTLNDVAVQVYARRLAIKAFRGFAEHVQWRAKQRAAAQLTFITHVFNAWADTARAIQTRRKRVECVIDDVMREDRERRMRLYLQCFQKHANWRRARCEELAVSLRRVMIATTRDAFEQWRLKVHRIGLCRRVINRGVVAWRERLAKPSHVGAFHRLYDALCAWRRVAHVVRERRDATSAAREYHMITLALKCMRAWRTRAHERRQTRFARRREFDLFISARRRRVQTLILIAWRRQALKRRARILAIELYYRSLARRTLLHWRRVVIFQMGAARMRPRLALAPLAEAVVSRNSHWRRLPTT